MKSPRRGPTLATLARQQSLIFLVGVLMQLLLGWLALSRRTLETAFLVVGAAVVAAATWTSVRLWREQRRAATVDLTPASLGAEQSASVESVVTVFDRLVLAAKDRRPSPVVTMIEHLPGLRHVRLLVSPDAPGSRPAADRVAELVTWAAAQHPRRQLNIALMDVRLPEARFDEDAQSRLVHALEASKALPGLVVDVTAGTKVMSLALLRAAEEARLPVTYLLQPGSDRTTAFQGLTSLSDPHGLFDSQDTGTSRA